MNQMSKSRLPRLFAQALSLLLVLAVVAGAAPRPVSAASPAAEVSCAQKYTVVAGDTLSGIAFKYNVTIEALAAANSLTSPYALYVGQVLCIPGSSSSTSGTTSTSSGPAIKLEIKNNRIYVDISKFKRGMYYVKAASGRINATKWTKIGRISVDKAGEADKSFRLPKGLWYAQQITVCFKHNVSDAQLCATMNNPNAR